MQYSVVAWYVVQAIWSVTTPFLLAGPLTDYLNQSMQRSAQLNPNATPPPIEFISGLVTWSIAIGAAIGVAVAALAIIGTMRRWRWVFYVVLVLLGLQALSFPFALLSAFTTSASSSLKMPVGITAGSVALGVPAVALFVWMLVAAIRRGPWAMTRG